MFALELEFLGGRYAASRHDDRDEPEWPPHPARLVFALVASAGSKRTPEEESALEWLCAQPPPAIACSSGSARSTVTAFVPVNDRPAFDKPRGASGTIPRERRPRTFPCFVPESPLVTYIWADAEPPLETRAQLASLAARVVYVGHSSSLVRARAVEQAPAATLVPGHSNQLLRVPSPGLVAALDDALARFEASGVRGALPSGSSSYRVVHETAAPPSVSVFGEMMIFRRVAGPRLPLAAAERVALSLRAAVMSTVPDPVPSAISGHDRDGTPLQQPHVGFVALPDVGHAHATGSLLGAAVVTPRAFEKIEREQLLCALEQISELRISRQVLWRLEPARVASGQPLPQALQSPIWTRAAHRYATATPIELDRFLDDNLGEEAENVVAESAAHIGLPRPARVSLSPVSPLVGGGHIHDIKRVGKRPRRPLVHAIVAFDEPVNGPVLLGSGRYRGLGLCQSLRRP